MYFDIPKGAKSKYVSSTTGDRLETPAATAKLIFGKGDRSVAVAAWEAANPDMILKGVKVNHKTPSMAGGCNNPHNVVPETAMPGTACKKIEAWQSTLENINDSL